MLDHRPACQARQRSLREPGYLRRCAGFHRVARDHRDPGPGRWRPFALAADQCMHEMQQRRGHARLADGFVQRPQKDDALAGGGGLVQQADEVVRPFGRDLPARFRVGDKGGAGAHQRAGCAVRAQQRRKSLAGTARVREDQPRRRVGGDRCSRQRVLRLPHHVIERAFVRRGGFGGGECRPEQVRKRVQHVLGVLAGRLEVPHRGVDAARIHADDGRRDLLQAEALPLERVVRQGRGGLGGRGEQRAPVELRALHVQRRECVFQCIARAGRRQPAVGEPFRRGRRVGLIRRAGQLQPVRRVGHLVGHFGAETARNQADRRPCERDVLKHSA
ncbi:hypothetical protein BCO9919_03789 [Burkholderia cenocepacia]|uniref:Uncharacterized protein n=1 Tax=Burkholderia cenocepacia TaxID=95486 RepID=A0A6J5JDU4_9BURK|nr:hypothetical protein BCO9919_03789 [Burkholderia cenocepacia]